VSARWHPKGPTCGRRVAVRVAVVRGSKSPWLTVMVDSKCLPAENSGKTVQKRRRGENDETGESGSSSQGAERDALNAVAEGFRCSITGALLLDPVSAADGQIYERNAIERWLSRHATSPNTGAKLESLTVVPLPAVRSAVQAIVDSGCLPKEDLREWLVRKGVALAERDTKSDRAVARACLERGLQLGEAVAGYHLGKMLIADAAAANVPEAIAETKREATHKDRFSGVRTIASAADVSAGDKVVLIPISQARHVFEDCPDINWSEHFVDWVDTVLTVREVDAEDQSILVFNSEEVSAEAEPSEVDEEDGLTFLWAPWVACMVLENS